MSKDNYYLIIAKAVASKSNCLRRQYGAIIVRNDEVIATGYNGPVRGNPHCTTCKREGMEHNKGDYSTCEAVHAEMNAIISASRRDMFGATLYLVGYDNGKKIQARPCEICSRLIQNAGIDRLVCS